MAERRRPARSRDRDPDGVIANRVIQDIIQNASAEFRDYLQRSGTVPQGGGAVPVAGGGAGLMPTPGGGSAVVGPMQGPPAPAGYSPPVNFDQMPFQPGYPTVPQNPVPMPPVMAPNTAMPMPNMGPTTYEDGSVTMPWDQPRFPAPQSLSMPDLLRLLGMA